MKLFHIGFLLFFILGCRPAVEIKMIDSIEPVSFFSDVYALRNQMDRTLSLNWIPNAKVTASNDNLFSSFAIYSGEKELLKIDDFETFKNITSYQMKNISSSDTIELRVVETVRNFSNFVENTIFDEKIGVVLAAKNLVPTATADRDPSSGIEANFSFTWDSVTEDSTHTPVIQDQSTFNQYDSFNNLLFSVDVLSSSGYTLQNDITDNNSYSFGLNASYSNADKTVRWTTEETPRVSVHAINLISGLIVPASVSITRVDTFDLSPTTSLPSWTNLEIGWTYSTGSGTGAIADPNPTVTIYEGATDTAVYSYNITPLPTAATAGVAGKLTVPPTALSADKSYYAVVSSDSTSVESFRTSTFPSTLLDTSEAVGIVSTDETYQFFDGLPLKLPDYAQNGVTILPTVTAFMENNGTSTPAIINWSEGRTENIIREKYTPGITPLTNAISTYNLTYSVGAGHAHLLRYEKPVAWIVSNFSVSPPIFNNTSSNVSLTINANNESTATEVVRLDIDGFTGNLNDISLATGTNSVSEDISYNSFRASNDSVDWALDFYYDRPNYPSLLFHSEEIDNLVPAALDITFISPTNTTYKLDPLGNPNNSFEILDSSNVAISAIENSVGLNQLGFKAQIKSPGTGISASNFMFSSYSLASGSVFTVVKTHKTGATTSLDYHLDHAVSLSLPILSVKYQGSYKLGSMNTNRVNNGVPVSYEDRFSLIATGDKAAYALYTTPTSGEEYSFLSWGSLSEREGLGPSIEYFDFADSRSVIESLSSAQETKNIYAGNRWVSVLIDEGIAGNSFATSFDNVRQNKQLGTSLFLPIGISSGSTHNRFLALGGGAMNSYGLGNNPNPPHIFAGGNYLKFLDSYGTQLTAKAAQTEKRDIAINANTSAFITRNAMSAAQDGLLYIRGTDQKIFGSSGKKVFNNNGSGTGKKYIGIVGNGSYYAVLDDDNKLWRIGQGLGLTASSLWTAPVEIMGLPPRVSVGSTGLKIVDMAAGIDHLLVLLSDGSLYAMGLNDKGQLGDGTTIAKTSFVQILNSLTIVDIAAGNKFSVALDNTGNLHTWGDNSTGELGIDKDYLAENHSPIQFW